MKSQSGYSFNIHEDVWSLHGGYLRFNVLAKYAAPKFVEVLKTILANITDDKKVSDASVLGYYRALANVLEYAHDRAGKPVADIDDEVLKGWIETNPGRYQFVLKTFLLKVQKKNKDAFPNVSGEFLKKIRATKSEYLDVLTLDPDKGPWLEAEVLAQDAALERAYTSGEMPEEKYLIAQLFRRYGPRRDQLARLKVGDVQLPSLHDGVIDASIRFPWGKVNKSVNTSPWRPIRADIEQAMLAYLEIRLMGIPKREWDNLPFFLPEGLPGVWSTANVTPKPSREIGYEGHCMAGTISYRFVRVMDSLELITHRTGVAKPMSFNTHRERHTIGTRLALQGLNAEEIKDLLMHVDPQSCEAYVHLGVQHFQLMRERLDVPMTPVAANFLSEPIEEEELFEGEFDVLIARDVPGLPVAGGGKCKSCTFKIDGSAPWACLSCPKFRVFADADLSLLWEELQRRKAYLYDANGEYSRKYDPALAINFERSEQALINAEARRQEYVEERDLVGA